MAQRVLMLSDSPVAPAEWLCAKEHEVAADHLAGGRVWGVCLDRGDLESALADARWLRRRRNGLPVVAVVDSAHMERAAELFDAGVEELIVRRPGAMEAARERLQRISRRSSELPARAAERIVARSPAMRACLELVAKAQRSPATVLLLGETGTGKEVIARAIHAGGPRAASPFVGINCAAFPETLLESELFGYERGAFTGAQRTKRGHFEVASGGTLFLDEIGETSLGFQVKLRESH